MAAKAQVITQHGIDIARMASIKGYLEGFEPFGKGSTQHAVGLFGMPVGLVIVLAQADRPSEIVACLQLHFPSGCDIF